MYSLGYYNVILNMGCGQINLGNIGLNKVNPQLLPYKNA